MDDAGITYAYAQQVAAGHGPRLTANEAPTEGYSNPLLVALLALASLLGLGSDLDTVSVGLNVGVASAAVAALAGFAFLHLRGLWRVFAAAPFALAVYWAGFSFWLAQGLENGLLMGLQVLSLLALYEAPRHRSADVALGLIAGLLTWTRPEGIVYGGVAVGVRWLTARKRRWLAASLFAGLTGLLYVLRWLLFHDLVPNTYWAKVEGRGLLERLLDREAKGRRYLTRFVGERWWYFAFPLWFAAPTWRPGAVVTAAGLGQLAFAVFFPLYSNGGWMAEHRLLQPMFGPLLVLATLGVLALFGPEPEASRGGDGRGRAASPRALVRPRAPRLGPFQATQGLLSWLSRPLRSARTLATRRQILALGVLGLFGLGTLWTVDWPKAQETIAKKGQIGLASVLARAESYGPLVRRWTGPRRPLVADVDIGGLAYEGDFDILDLVGLSDRALARARRRRPAWGPDYVYGERRPEVIHLAASWQRTLPYQRLSAARGRYRTLANAGIPEPLRHKGVTALDAQLLDPLAPPVRAEPVAAPPWAPDLSLLGISALPAPGEWLVVVHARARAAGRAGGGHKGGKRATTTPRVDWRDASGHRYGVEWHAGLRLAPGAVPPGLSVVGFSRIPRGARLPLALTRHGSSGPSAATREGPLVLASLPTARAGDESIPALTRVALLRASGLPVPPCDPEKVVDPTAEPVAQARGAGFVARLCGGLPRELAERWRRRAHEAAEEASTPDARWDAAAATLAFGVPQWLSTRLLLEDARDRHTPFDEVLDAWALAELAADGEPGREERPEGTRGDRRAGAEGERRVHLVRALRLLDAARRWDDVLLYGLAFGRPGDGTRALVCRAAARLGLRSGALGSEGGCDDVPPPRPLAITRQSFEDPGDPRLAFEEDGLEPAALRPTMGYRPGTHQGWVLGGHGRLLLNTYGQRIGDDVEGEVVWGPLPWSGGRFGALLGGGRGRAGLEVRVEGKAGGRWKTLARLRAASSGELLRAYTAHLRGGPTEEVRVVVVDRVTGSWGHLLVDALTFVDLP